jgi:hypothetical protein
MSELHSHPMKIADLRYSEKTSWIIPRKRLACGHGIDPLRLHRREPQS